MKICDLPESRILINLIEECGEVIQAATKYLRAQYGDTPISEEDAWKNLIEEIADVYVCTDAIVSDADRMKIRAIRTRKRKRWEKRLEQETETIRSV